MFGIPLSQCIENDRIARIAAGEVTDVGCLTRSSRHGSRTSFSSLIETPMTIAAKTEEVKSEIGEFVRKILLRFRQAIPARAFGVSLVFRNGIVELTIESESVAFYKHVVRRIFRRFM